MATLVYLVTLQGESEIINVDHIRSIRSEPASPAVQERTGLNSILVLTDTEGREQRYRPKKNVSGDVITEFTPSEATEALYRVLKREQRS